MSRVQSPRARADRAFAVGGHIDQGSRAKIRDRLSRLASALEEPCFGGSPRGVYRRRRATKDQLEEIVADESLALIDHYRIVRGALYKGFSAASELGDGNSLALLAGRLHENFRDCGRLTGELQRLVLSLGTADHR
jgi:hypothetical protein